jgi:heptosyltransferase-3
VALHPGSGRANKNWAIENWIELGNDLLGRIGSRSDGFPAVGLNKRRSGERRSLMIVSGEADQLQIEKLESIWKDARVVFAKNLPLPHLAAVLEQTVFVGHDSGVSHLAAAAGANCILLFGPTDPEIWAPRNANVRVIRAPDGDLRSLDVDLVHDALATLIDIGLQAGVSK